MEDNIIKFENVSKIYKDKVVLENFNLDIKKGEFLTIIGSSGCGKTTVLKLINGLIYAEKGKVIVNGNDILQTNQIQLRRNIGYVIQDIGLFPHMTVERNISYVLNLSKIKNKKLIKDKVDTIIKVVGMDYDILKRYPSELSGGQKQRVGIARALVSSPKILLMDEPFCSVDEITRRILQEAIIDIYKNLGVTIIFITHDIKEALKLGTKVAVMNEGKIIQYSSPCYIKEKPKTDFVRDLVKGY
ncbi:MAG TPA: ABC transporter ATP-binding protein [Terrisporobacter glycolicus]|uniref:Glycine betaine/carnitine/choline transport ATP-binding protein OpuCA n=1 Tax=Terrisporobacter petrolearius TaxID=1460447 RepID=A0ABZ3F977_9FIRM|nr:MULTISPECIES: ABC transporter ATP-binding protein [Terrisporobacter]MBN9648182.1 ABC transporter ATP-binding protein [Terrisporobacter glycolicus]UPA30926.1 ABC transporter ATP-binding protein [Terrisporobacter glycolicus]SFJ50075.1 osmoprotectant transport system ATP-binding protein [Terrisporobacter glycolicus]HBI92333.1 ABC transporter ATP-binding protein [Terrisporobacter hibernicus]